MTEPNTAEFYTIRHDKLIRFASLADTVGWIFLGYFILSTLTGLCNGVGSYQQKEFCEYWQSAMLSCVGKRAIALLEVFIHPLARLATGLFWMLILKGVALGLRMLVETDLNYRGQLQEETVHE